MNEDEIPNQDFDEVLAFIEEIIEKHSRKKMTIPTNGHLQRIWLLNSIIDQLETIRNTTEKELPSNLNNNGPRILPIHRGYTVDIKLQQFRKAIPHHTLEFIPFDSIKGEALLNSIEEERPDIIE